MGDFKEKLSDKTAIVAIHHISNVTGLETDVKEICALSKKVGALSVVDGAQAAGHKPVNVADLGCDFYAFSGHKMMGPTGIGVLYG